MKTFRAVEKDFNRKTYIVDASGKTLGRLATRVAGILMGKGKTTFAYDQLCGDQVIITHAEKIRVTGNKSAQKVYLHYTGYYGGLRSTSYEKMLTNKPEEIISEAIRRMLPKTKTGREMMRRLRVFAGAEHPHTAQKPVALEV